MLLKSIGVVAALLVVSASAAVTGVLAPVAPSAPTATAAAVPAPKAKGGFAAVEDMMSTLDSQLDQVVGSHYTLVQTRERTARATAAATAAHLASATATDATADEETAVEEAESEEAVADESEAAEAEADAESEEVVVDESAEEAAEETADDALVETDAEAGTETEAEAEAETETETEADAETAAETDAEKKPKKAAKASKASKKSGGKSGKSDDAAGAAAIKALAGPVAPIGGAHEIPLIPKDYGAMSDLPSGAGPQIRLDSLRSADAHPELLPGTAAAIEAMKGKGPRGVDGNAFSARMDRMGLMHAAAANNEHAVHDLIHMTEAQSAATTLGAGHSATLFSDPFRVFGRDAIMDAHTGVGVSNDVIEKGSLLQYLSTAENAVTASSTLYTRYNDALNTLINQIRLYKPNVAEWIIAQKVKAVETVDGVKATLATFGPQIRALQRVYADALAKEQYYHKQVSQLQSERMLQTSSPSVAAVEASMMPNDKYATALETLQTYMKQATQIRSDAEHAIRAKKKALKDGKIWLSGAPQTLMSWLRRQRSHLKVVLREAHALASRWADLIRKFKRVHIQSTHLVRQYQLSLQRMGLHDQLRRLRLAWNVYRVRHAHGSGEEGVEGGHASNDEMARKFGELHASLRTLQAQQDYNGAPASPPAEWLSILSAEPHPKSHVPLSTPPINIPLSSAAGHGDAKHFMGAPVEPMRAEPVAGSEPINHLTDPLHAPAGMVGVFPTPQTYPFPHTGLDGVPHGHSHGGATPLPPNQPPSALAKQPAKAKDADADADAKKKGDDEAGSGGSGGEESFIQKTAALSHALNSYGAESVFAGAAAPPSGLEFHPSNPTVTANAAHFDRPLQVAPIPAAPVMLQSAATVTSTSSSTTMPPPPVRRGGAMGFAPQPPALITLPPPPSSGAASDMDGLDF